MMQTIKYGNKKYHKSQNTKIKDKNIKPGIKKR